MTLRAQSFLILFFFFVFAGILLGFSYSAPMDCTDTSRLCTSFIAFKPDQNQSLPIIQSMFDASPDAPPADEGAGLGGYVYVRKNCSCLRTTHKYATNTTFTVRQNHGYVYDLVMDAYSGLAFPPNTTRAARPGAVVSVQLLCGCSSGLWNYLMSYVVSDGDSVQSLSSRFGVSMDRIEEVNGISNPDNITVGDLFYIPLDSVPGEPYSTEKANPAAPAPAPGSNNSDVSADQKSHSAKDHVPYIWIVGGLGAVLALLVICILICVCMRTSSCFRDGHSNDEDDDNGRKVSHKFRILRKSGFFCGSGRYMCCRSADIRQTNGEPTSHQITVSTALAHDIFDVDKPVVFTYGEILAATDEFSDSNLLGHGNYGSVYFGILRDQEVAVKRMTATKTKEFGAEMKVLCKVHHSNLVELIGYAATNDELFVVYEYVQKGILKSHLHDPQSKGNTPLSWIMRVQIALDAARGLEYIHEHTKTHYVHRDIKTSNILLDESFRAKISDFGLAKLLDKPGEGETTVTKVVGTYGYLAPEYLSDGLATTKSDVYAFGVVLFEIISGKEAVIRTEAVGTKNPERRPLATIILTALRSSPDSTRMASLKEFIDPNLVDLYPNDCLFKVAMLAKQCVDDDPILRPDMKQVVISLSQTLLSSIEWEATLAGNSQVFSGLVQGR
ncbi:PREDICTED: lysM domain receptor-like kinase 3 [Tarenaya hassleriana]|uniref:lysM domain receptor-like kinase 3 n=1 Tax=Tarenaya hassleriana TaxID=28532 RepID=UPI00053C727F|nr:PREDICTED: lysM domain receptor-like kinase 3 [Tarenaya hassleriana]